MKAIILLFFFLTSATTVFSQQEFDQEFELKFENDEDTFDEETEEDFDLELDDSFSEMDDSFEPTDELEKLEPIKTNRFTENEPENKVPARDGKYIYHPNQEKGLYKINKNDEYLYKYEKSKINGFFHIKAGAYSFKNFPTENSTLKFRDFYDSNTALTFLFEYDWAFFKNIQSLSLNFSGGLSYNRGRGKFRDTSIDTPVQEKYTLWFIPMGVGLTYKFKMIDNQIFLPFVNASLNYNLLMEYREGFDAFEYLGVFGAHVAGGVSINLGWFQRLTALQLDQDFGINNVYLTLEGRQVFSFEEEYNLSGFVFIGGLSFEY